MMRGSRSVVLACFSCLLSAVFGEDSAVKNENHSLPRLVLARKHISREALVVESNKLVLSYEVYNLGDLPAIDVTVTDEIDMDWFDIVGGSSNVRIAELAPQGRYAYNVTIVPKKYGPVVVNRAVVQYTISGVTKRMVSSSPGRLDITSAAAYLRATSYYIKEWLLFALFTSVPTALPALYYFTHK